MNDGPGPDPAHEEAFFLYAETFVPDESARTGQLDALARCAESTLRVAPSVATYAFRRSRLAALAGERRFPGSLALESTELYLTPSGFRDHLATDEFRSALRTMYREISRLGVSIRWIGARPPADAVRNIFRSDPEARPLATLRVTMYDARRAAAATSGAALVSVACPLPPGGGAAAVEAVDALAERLRAISFVAFFHPEVPRLLRVFATVPLDPKDDGRAVAAAFADLDAVTDPAARTLGNCLVPRGDARSTAAMREAFARSRGDWDVADDGYSGYVLHPQAPRSDGAHPSAAPGGRR